MASAVAGAGAGAEATAGAAIKGALKGGLLGAAVGLAWEKRYDIEEKLTGRDAKLSRDLVEAVNARFHPTRNGPSFKDVFAHYQKPAAAFAESSLPQSMKYFGHDAGPQKVDVATNVSVSGEVHGEAQIMNRIIVEPSPLLQTIVREVQQLKVHLAGEIAKSATNNNGPTPRVAHQLGLGGPTSGVPISTGAFGFGVAGTK